MKNYLSFVPDDKIVGDDDRDDDVGDGGCADIGGGDDDYDYSNVTGCHGDCLGHVVVLIPCYISRQPTP